MNRDQIEGKWKQYSGEIKEKWGKLTDGDLTTISGRRDQLVGKLHERYGLAKDQAEKQVDEFTRSLGAANEETEEHKTDASGDEPRPSLAVGNSRVMRDWRLTDSAHSLTPRPGDLLHPEAPSSSCWCLPSS